MVYIILCILNAFWNCCFWIRITDKAFTIKDTIKHPYLIGFLLSIPYFSLKTYEMIYPDELEGILYILGEIFVIVSRMIIVKKLVDIDFKKNAIFVIFQYILYTISKSFCVIIVMLLSISLHYSYDMIASIFGFIITPALYYGVFRCYRHVIGKYHIYTNKYLLVTIGLFAFLLFCDGWVYFIAYLLCFVFLFITLYSIQDKQSKYQKSLAIQEEKDMMIEEYQEIEQEQLKLRKQKHDFLNHLYTIQILLENHQKQEALEYIERYREKM